MDRISDSRFIMKIRIISPEYYSYAGIKETESLVQRKLTPIYLAALAQEEHEIEVIDGDIDEVIIDQNTDLVAISFNSNHAQQAYEIASKYREINIPVVFGGFHPSLFPKEAKKYADAIVIGEAETQWPLLLKDLENNRLQQFYQGDCPVELSNIPIPRYDLYDKAKYNKIVPMFITRGCPYNCSFCCIKTVYGNSFRKRPINEVVKQIEFIKENYDDSSPIPLTIDFIDDNIWGDKKYAMELFKALKSLEIHWQSQGASIKLDDELIHHAADSGCNLLFIGFESLIPDNLRYLNKSQNDLESYESFIAKLHQNKIGIGSYFILGLPYDNLELFEDIEIFLLDNCVEFPIIMLYQLVPGTESFKKAKYDIFNYQQMINSLPLYTHKDMSKQEFRKKFVQLHRNLYSREGINKRLSHTRNLGLRYINKENHKFYANPQWDEWVNQI
ncbi:MAG: B12-binding domain-containing radical SAM protein [Spirochaetes bacterium]|nr:B12-binding domain-containing radical SAM protein [Spirochaetota bacterium]